MSSPLQQLDPAAVSEYAFGTQYEPRDDSTPPNHTKLSKRSNGYQARRVPSRHFYPNAGKFGGSSGGFGASVMENIDDEYLTNTDATLSTSSERFRRIIDTYQDDAHNAHMHAHRYRDRGASLTEQSTDSLFRAYPRTQISRHRHRHRLPVKNSADDENSVHILVIYKNTSICLKFPNPNISSALPIIFNMNLQTLQRAFDCASVSIPGALIIEISQFLFPKKVIKCKSNGRVQSISSNTNFRTVFGAYCLDEADEPCLEEYAGVVKSIGAVCQQYQAATENPSKFLVFDQYIFSNICSVRQSNRCDLCRVHYVANEILL